MGFMMRKAVEFIVTLLSEGEKPSAEVIELAKEAGISDGTFKRAVHRVIGIKSRKSNNRWYMSLPTDFSREKLDGFEPMCSVNPMRLREERSISSDWVSVTPQDNDCVKHKIDIPSRVPPIGGIHIKVGAVEFKADAGFPADKLAEILRGLAVQDG